MDAADYLDHLATEVERRRYTPAALADAVERLLARGEEPPALVRSVVNTLRHIQSDRPVDTAARLNIMAACVRSWHPGDDDDAEVARLKRGSGRVS